MSEIESRTTWRDAVRNSCAVIMRTGPEVISDTTENRVHFILPCLQQLEKLGSARWTTDTNSVDKANTNSVPDDRPYVKPYLKPYLMLGHAGSHPVASLTGDSYDRAVPVSPPPPPQSSPPPPSPPPPSPPPPSPPPPSPPPPCANRHHHLPAPSVSTPHRVVYNRSPPSFTSLVHLPQVPHHLATHATNQ